MDFTELSGLNLYKTLDKIYKPIYNIYVRRRKDGTEMKKTLYSLMLSEEVMREIDALAHKMGTNRSNLVNMILAEKVEMRTPEQQMNDIFSGIEQLLASSRELIPLFAPNTQRVTVRSSLEYKYHPTVRYEVELVNGFVPGEPIGTLTANFRTQSQGLLELLGRFFRCLCRIEGRVLPVDVAYSIDSGRFTRTLAYPMTRDGKDGVIGAEGDFPEGFPAGSTVNGAGLVNSGGDGLKRGEEDKHLYTAAVYYVEDVVNHLNNVFHNFSTDHHVVEESFNVENRYDFGGGRGLT